jgi:electron transfer flavoprotein beta subunit
LLELPRVAVVTRIDWSGTGLGTVDRELEGGLIDVVEVDTPALLTVQTGINKPRYANLRAIKQAEQQEISVVAVDAGEPAYRVRRMITPPRGAGAELLDGDLSAVAQRIVELVTERLG